MLSSTTPHATYRLQFNATFTFDDAIKIIPYLSGLGVSHVYASPIQMARPGSMHGYDIVDHTRINPELGGEQAFLRFCEALNRAGLKLLLDIVPNHMGVGGSDNPWWLSILEWGDLSPFANAFDIDWERPGAKGKLVVPFLGKSYGAALHAGELKLSFEPDDGAFSIFHWEHKFPINPLDYFSILEWAQIAGGGGFEMRPLFQINAELRNLAEMPRPVTREGRVERCQQLKKKLATDVQASPKIRKAIQTAVEFANGDPSAPESFAALHRIIQSQSYRLAYWRVASEETNYRRFFDINSLAGLRVEENSVFESTHALIFDLIESGKVHGLRIDHIDGLADPSAYLQSLRARVGPEVYIIVEKILEADEKLPSWPIAGTTGYEAMRFLDGVFVCRGAETFFNEMYEGSVGIQEPFSRQLRQTKIELLRNSFRSELETLVSDIKRAAEQDLATSDFTLDSLRRALAEVIACLPVYRTYISNGGPEATDRTLIVEAVAKAKVDTSLDTTAAHDLLRSILLVSADAERSPYLQTLLERIVRRFQQITGPIMAKSLEDTLFYRYARFVALNDVGNDPHEFGVSDRAFHSFCSMRVTEWPDAITATATHDTKRGEDVRARLLALSHRPESWRRILASSEALAAEVPDANDRYMLLQTIIGAWPVDGLHAVPVRADDTFRARISEYAIKAVRESKRRSAWTAVDEAYESALDGWIGSLLSSAEFYKGIAEALPELALAGVRIMMARLVLKLTMPGIPDIYQGCEFEDFSLVDPDNRRPVDYEAREHAFYNKAESWSALKQSVLTTILQDRAQHRDLYLRGTYDAVFTDRQNLLCFRRKHETQEALVAVKLDPFCRRDLFEDLKATLGSHGWGNLLEGCALEQRKHGGADLPAVVLRKTC